MHRMHLVAAVAAVAAALTVSPGCTVVDPGALWPWGMPSVKRRPDPQGAHTASKLRRGVVVYADPTVNRDHALR